MIVLIGDSIFVRMNKSCPIPDSLSLATSGASVSFLPNNPSFYKLIHTDYFKENPNHNHSNDVLCLLAGTNDFLKSVDVDDVKKSHRKLVNYCLRRFKHIVLCQIPPIPNLPVDRNETIRLFNRWLVTVYAQNPKVTVVNSFHPFLSEHTLPYPLVRYYELTYPSGKTDLIHLNRDGLLILRNIILSAIPA
uniref:SGNH hydrolase-type esterase domain-containing protein n=1 Tax=Cacopsylla melanoneura TaxID=428564 RepID=A0A8D8ZAY6_9HEMI